MRNLLVFVLLGALLLSLTNPSTDDFAKFVEDRAETMLADHAGDSRMARILSDLGAGLARSLARRLTDRKNYVVFSTYTMSLNGSGDNDMAWRFVGVAGTFYELDRPEPLREER